MTPKPPAEVRTINASDILHPKDHTLSQVLGSHMPAFTNTLLDSIAGTVWNYRDDNPVAKNQRVAAALAAVRAFEPKNEIESMMAAQAVALHLASMECARRAMLADQPGEAAMRLRRDAAILSRAMVDMAEAIDRRRGKGPQVVRVVVHEGGQAIVGTITAGATAGGGGECRWIARKTPCAAGA